jgi:hypothetical protein
MRLSAYNAFLLMKKITGNPIPVEISFTGYAKLK